MIHYPRVDIEFCTKCRWNLRAAWYAQELLSTFGDKIGEVSMAPGESGVFQVRIIASEGSPEILLWDRKTMGFPDSKDLKQLVRDVIEPGRSLGHSDRKTPAESAPKDECKECEEAREARN